MSSIAIQESSSPLPTYVRKQLHKEGDFYICSHFTQDVLGPSVTTIDGKIYYRFMNFIYSPCRPEQLTSEQVVSLCDLRLEYMDGLVDRQLNGAIVEAMVQYAHEQGLVTPHMSVLDFGCGSALSTKLLLKDLHVPELQITGVDISAKAIKNAEAQALQARFIHTAHMPSLADKTFDLITAVFVMHFTIDTQTLSELRRVLRPSGKFLFNIYHRDLNAVWRQLSEAGFGTIEEVPCDRLRIREHHKIMSCGILTM